jgi:hypothetical protein
MAKLNWYSRYNRDDNIDGCTIENNRQKDASLKTKNSYINMRRSRKKYSHTLCNNVHCLFRHDQWEIDRNTLIIGDEKLGNGAFAIVYKATIIGKPPILAVYKNLSFELAGDGGVVAVKVLPPHADADNKNDFLNEIKFMKRLGYHSHIVSMLGCVSEGEQPMLVVEYCAHGDMLRFLRRHKHCLIKVCDPISNRLH